MKIIALSSFLSTKRGGLEHSLFDVCRNLAKRGHSITLVYEEGGDQLGLYQQICKRMIKINSYHLNLKFLTDLLKVQPSDCHDTIIYSNQYDNFFFASSLATIYNLPIVCHLRLHASIEDGYLKRIKQRLTFAKIDHYIAISEAVKKDWCNRLYIPRQNVSVVHNGIEPEQFSYSNTFDDLRRFWNIPIHEKVVSYVGRLEPEKGIENLIRAFALLRQVEIPSKLLIAGKPLFSGTEYLVTLKRLAHDLGVTEHVRFLGHISDPCLLYQISDVTVLPSLWLEAFGRVIIESMACGTPAIGSKTGGIPEVLTGKFSDWLFKPGDELDLFNILRSVIYWRDRDPGLAIQCRQYVIDNFSLEKTIDGVESVLHQALNS